MSVPIFLLIIKRCYSQCDRLNILRKDENDNYFKGAIWGVKFDKYSKHCKREFLLYGNKVGKTLILLKGIPLYSRCIELRT